MEVLTIRIENKNVYIAFPKVKSLKDKRKRSLSLKRYERFLNKIFKI